MRKQKLIDQTIPKFLLVGIVNTLIGSSLMFVLYNLIKCSYWLSSAANYIIGGTVSFFLNKYFTFQNSKWSWQQAGRFTVIVIASWLLAYGATKPLVSCVLASQPIKLQENIAMLIGVCLYTVLNYLGQRFFAFQN